MQREAVLFREREQNQRQGPTVCCSSHSHYLPMLDLEVVPERSLGNEQWEFALGECHTFKNGEDEILYQHNCLFK